MTKKKIKGFMDGSKDKVAKEKAKVGWTATLAGQIRKLEERPANRVVVKAEKAEENILLAGQPLVLAHQPEQEKRKVQAVCPGKRKARSE